MGIFEHGIYKEVHPTFLYESIANLAIFVILIFIEKHCRGRIACDPRAAYYATPTIKKSLNTISSAEPCQYIERKYYIYLPYFLFFCKVFHRRIKNRQFNDRELQNFANFIINYICRILFFTWEKHKTKKEKSVN